MDIKETDYLLRSYGDVAKIKEKLGYDRKTVTLALDGKKDTVASREIRKYAIEMLGLAPRRVN